MIWLLKLYPRAWRDRYGLEARDVIESQPRSLRLVVDLLGGAFDAHWEPQTYAQFEREAATEIGESKMLSRLKRCRRSETLSRKDATVAAAWTLGSALFIAAIMLVGHGPVTESIGLIMFPGVLGVGTIWLQSRGNSTAARLAVTVGPMIILFLFGLAVGLVQSR